METITESAHLTEVRNTTDNEPVKSAPITESPSRKPRRPNSELTPLQLRRRAVGLVHLAVRRGKLPSLDGSIKCTDCDEPAAEYDHRNYNHALAVDPVCISCNRLRGPGFPLNPDGNEYTSWVARKLNKKGRGRESGWNWIGPEKKDERRLGPEKSVADFVDEHWVTWEPDKDVTKITQESALARQKRCYFSFQKSFLRGLYDWYGLEP